mmetsp:Transcript_15768/g.39031  ORF Transcript_15768/g.39031 Transcript_15768/m.39031 type:complete len:219 (-) Transcript_15768:2261-2917(-)
MAPWTERAASGWVWPVTEVASSAEDIAVDSAGSRPDCFIRSFSCSLLLSSFAIRSLSICALLFELFISMGIPPPFAFSLACIDCSRVLFRSLSSSVITPSSARLSRAFSARRSLLSSRARCCSSVSWCSSSSPSSSCTPSSGLPYTPPGSANAPPFGELLSPRAAMSPSTVVLETRREITLTASSSSSTCLFLLFVFPDFAAPRAVDAPGPPACDSKS